MFSAHTLVSEDDFFPSVTGEEKKLVPKFHCTSHFLCTPRFVFTGDTWGEGGGFLINVSIIFGERLCDFRHSIYGKTPMTHKRTNIPKDSLALCSTTGTALRSAARRLLLTCGIDGSHASSIPRCGKDFRSWRATGSSCARTIYPEACFHR